MSRVVDDNAVSSLLNATTGFGQPGKDPRIGGYFGFGPQITYAEASAMYTTNWVARKIVDIPAQDAMRGWRDHHSPDTDPEQIKTVQDIEKNLKVRQKILRCMTWARLFGGSVLLMGVADGKQLSEPLDPESITEGQLEFVQPLDMWQVGVEDIEIANPYTDDYWEPQFYNVYGYRVHHSRLIKFIGEDVPYQIAGYYNYFGISSLQPCYEQLRDVAQALAGASILTMRASQDVIKTPQLWDYVGTNDEARIKNRFTLLELQRSVLNMLVLDSDEDFQQIPTTFAGLEGVLDTMLQMVTGAADIPATRFFGQSPKGFNATGESDMRNYYDNVSAYRENVLRPKLEQLDEILIRSAIGKMPNDWSFDFPSLWEPTATEQATIDSQILDKYLKMADLGVPTDVILRDLKEEGISKNLTDEKIDEIEAEPEFFPNPFEEENGEA